MGKRKKFSGYFYFKKNKWNFRNQCESVVGNKKRKSVVFPFIIVLIVVFLAVFKVNRSSNEVDNDFCEKEIKLAFR